MTFQVTWNGRTFNVRCSIGADGIVRIDGGACGYRQFRNIGLTYRHYIDYVWPMATIKECE